MRQALAALGVPQQQAYPPPGRPRLDAAGLSLDRDLSLIEFHRRVFDEARDEANPLLERVKFLSIVGTIIDEFAVTRYAELAGGDVRAPRAAHLGRIDAEITDLLAEARSYLREDLVPTLAREGIHLLDCTDLQPTERADVESYFTESVLPLLMPLGFDAARPFPHVSSGTLALAVVVRGAGQEHFACVQVPEAIPALVRFPWRRAEAAGSRARASLEQGYVWLDQVVAEHLTAAFPGMQIVQVHPFRVFRDAGLGSDLSEGGALREAVERGLRRREFGDVLTLIVGEGMPEWLVELLSKNLGLRPAAVHRHRDLTDLAKLAGLSRIERPDLHYPLLVPRTASGLARRRSPGRRASLSEAHEGAKSAQAATRWTGRDIFASIRQGDVLLHHPYESFQPVIEFVEGAALDPDVLAISTTLYRAGHDSPIVNALLKARRAGKQVRVVIELRAQFDERNNITWGRALEEAGAHVVYGMVGLKVHAKLTLIVRREAGRPRRYVHLSSGNYNPETSKVYTDLALFTCNEDLGRDATDLFNLLTGYASPAEFRTLLVAPLTLRKRLLDMIEREIAWARQGQAAHMILKVNALTDEEIIESFCRASQAGVRIDLIVRGICCLRPGIPGVSDNIRVRSIVGRFLEHSRAWYFRNGGNEEIYLGSADLMPRNLNDRVEVMVRLDDIRLKQRVHREILAVYLADNVKARGAHARRELRTAQPSSGRRRAQQSGVLAVKPTLMAVVLALGFSAPLAAQEVRVDWRDHPTLRAGKWLRVDVRALVQEDVRRSEATDEGFDADIARRRVGIEGRLARIFDYQVEYEFGAREWRDVYVNYRQFKMAQVRAGTFKLPFGLDENTSSTKLDFVYRSRISSRLAPGRDLGVAAHGSLFHDVLIYEAGVFQHDGENAQPSKSTRVFGGRATAARLVVNPFRGSKSALADLQVGVASSGTTVPEGFPAVRARTVFGASFFQSDVWVNGHRQRTGLEVRWRPGPFSLQGEYMRLTDERRGESVEDGDLPPLVAEGWYLAGTFTVTGERKSKGPNTPRRPFRPFSKGGGIGGVEVAARVETLRFGSTEARADLSTSRRAETVLGNSDHALTLGVNWYLNRFVKVQANLIREWIHDPSTGPLPDRSSFWSHVFRLQFAI